MQQEAGCFFLCVENIYHITHLALLRLQTWDMIEFRRPEKNDADN